VTHTVSVGLPRTRDQLVAEVCT